MHDTPIRETSSDVAHHFAERLPYNDHHETFTPNEVASQIVPQQAAHGAGPAAILIGMIVVEPPWVGNEGGSS